jgi:hypothetical protein
MKAFVLAAALALVAGPTLADEVIVTPAPGVAVEHQAGDVEVTKEKTIHHDADGCTTKSMTKTNDEGDSVTKTKSNC